MTESYTPKRDWNRAGPRVLAALVIVLIGLCAFYVFGRSDNAAEQSQRAAFEAQMDKAQAKSDTAQAGSDAARAEAWR